MTTKVPTAILILAAVSASGRLDGQAGYRPSAANLAAREWFQDARFGLFIHWGISSLLMDGEWVMENRGMRIPEYEKLAQWFDPVGFDPAEWVSLARAAGMRYITLITKHHDGFALWDSKSSSWDVMDRTPYRRDIVRLLAEECRRQGMKLFLYYSQVDWHHPDYFPRGRTGLAAGRPDSGRWERYLDYMDAQLRELLTEYGEIGGIWFDGEWDKPDAAWRLDRTYGLIHQLQPAVLVGSNHHGPPHPGEDFQMFEKDLPGEHTTGFNPEQPVSLLPLETAETMNDSWGFRLHDRRYKSVGQLIRYLVNAAGRNANLLLNVGPMPDGRIQPEFVERLRAMGRWMESHGEAVYGTRGGPIPPRPWGVTTQKGNRVYVHVLDWSDSELSLPRLPGRVRQAFLLVGGAPIQFRENQAGVTLVLPPRSRDEVDQVIVLELGS